MKARARYSFQFAIKNSKRYKMTEKKKEKRRRKKRKKKTTNPTPNKQPNQTITHREYADAVRREVRVNGAHERVDGGLGGVVRSKDLPREEGIKKRKG